MEKGLQKRKQKKQKRKTINFVVFATLMGLVFLQTAFFVGALIQANFSETLRENDYSAFYEKVDEKKSEAENLFVSKWSNGKYYEEILALCEETYSRQTEAGDPLQVDEAVARSLITMVQNINVSGGFVVFDREPMHDGNKDAFGIRDYNTKVAATGNSDILMEFGSIELAKALEVSLDSYWRQFYSVGGDEKSKVYRKVAAAAQGRRVENPYELGYWSHPFRMSQFSLPVITYTIPLIHRETGTYYGVIGVELGTEYLSGLLFDKRDTVPAKKKAYSLAMVRDPDTAPHVYENITFSGSYYKNIANDNQIRIAVEGSEKFSHRKTGSHSRYYLKEDSVRFTTVAVPRMFSVYDENSPFFKEKWYIVGMIDKNVLFAPSRRVSNSVSLIVMVSFCMGIVEAFFLSLFLSRQIKKLIGAIRNKGKNPAEKIPRTEIVELDQLIDSIEQLSNDVADNASKMRQIINAVRLPMGAIEVSRRDRRVTVIGKTAEILGWEEAQQEDRTQPEEILSFESYRRKREEFLEKAVPYKARPDKGGELHGVTYEYRRGGALRYITIVGRKTKGKRFLLLLDKTEEILEMQQLEYERDHDALTSLLNRGSFKRRVQALLESGHVRTGAMVMWDLDNLKLVNDSYGHDYGDLYIREASKIIGAIPMKHFEVSRISGDEFFAFIYNFESQEEVLQCLKTIQSTLINTFVKVPGENPLKIRATTGVAWYTEGSPYEMLVKYADFAMYSAREVEKGSIQTFDMEKYAKEQMLYSGGEALNELLEKKTLHFAFQPIVSASTGEIYGYEALMRPEGKLDSIRDVLKLAKAQSKLYQLEKLTWECALDSCYQQKDRLKEARIFINSIPNIALCARDLQMLTENYKDLLSRVVVEIVECEHIDNDCMNIKKEVKQKWNCGIALDDFGAGYSNESTLLFVDPDFVKIDMVIIRNIDTDQNRKALVQNVLQYTKQRGIKTIAEGIERPEEMETLIRMGVDYLQGFYVGRPARRLYDIEEGRKKEIRKISSLKH